MSRFFTRFFVPIVALLLLLAAAFLYYHHAREQRVAVMNQQGAMRNINESVYDLMRIRGEGVFNDSCATYLRRYVEHYDKQGLRVTIISALGGNVLFDSSLPAGVDAAESHAGRPEVVQALSRGQGYDVRRQSSVHNEEYFYVLPEVKSKRKIKNIKIITKLIFNNFLCRYWKWCYRIICWCFLTW